MMVCVCYAKYNDNLTDYGSWYQHMREEEKFSGSSGILFAKDPSIYFRISISFLQTNSWSSSPILHTKFIATPTVLNLPALPILWK